MPLGPVTFPTNFIIESCRECPFFKTRKVQHWIAYPQPLYEYKCSRANRYITPNDGVKPPPKWCPLRKED